ncbi:probable maltase-glucoamylase 2 isoform X2 [Halyomorpha halys]|uniref:probable maltase-glucoamylase 2 isoform X2 n=1 Tax=Halyomorpha halys TaxID=286706 RepID=UPI0006D4DF75|nr:uncharacterized protein LOC106679724 isoform X2 [Halyomorpha halys]
MNRQIIHYKITLTGPGNEVEIRYIAMETISYHNYPYFTQKLMAAFPVLENIPFSVYWKDREGDIVKICSDDELTIALDEMKDDSVKRLYITINKDEGNVDMLHPDVECDCCDQPIKGFRYKCLVCYDYELCAICERNQTHAIHPMIRIPKPIAPDTSYGKQFTKDMPKISQHLERLFQETGGEANLSNNQKTPADNKQHFKFCQNDIHNLIANLLIEKLIKHNIETTKTQQKGQQEIHSNQPSSSADIHVRNEPQNINGLTSELRSLSIDVNSGSIRTEGLTCQDEPVHSTSGGQRLVTLTSSTPGANVFPSKATNGATRSGVLPLEAISVSEIDAPIPADPTPVLQAQLTPPISASNTVPTPIVSIPIPVLNASGSSKNTVAPPCVPPILLSRLLTAPPAEDSIKTSTLNISNNIPVPSITVAPPCVPPILLSRLLAAPPAEDSMKTCSLDNSKNIPVSNNTVASHVPPPDPVVLSRAFSSFAEDSKETSSLNHSNNIPVPNNTVASRVAPPAPVVLSRGIAAPFAEDLINTTSVNTSNNIPVVPNEDDGSLDNSWSVVENEESPELTPASAHSSATEQSSEVTPASALHQKDSPPAQDIGLFEESLMMLYTLGFEKKEWVKILVESKDGDIREVLRFLSPVKKPSTNLN